MPSKPGQKKDSLKNALIQKQEGEKLYEITVNKSHMVGMNQRFDYTSKEESRRHHGKAACGERFVFHPSMTVRVQARHMLHKVCCVTRM